MGEELPVDEASVLNEDLAPLRFEDLRKEVAFDQNGLGVGGALLFSKTDDKQLFKDRELLRRVFLSGKANMSISQLVDLYSVSTGDTSGAKKRKRARAPKPQVERVLQAAFDQFPRLGQFVAGVGERDILLRRWPMSEKGQVLFHNELMQCCRVSLQQLSKKRATYYDTRPSRPSLVLAAPADASGAGASSVEEASALVVRDSSGGVPIRGRIRQTAALRRVRAGGEIFEPSDQLATVFEPSGQLAADADGAAPAAPNTPPGGLESVA